MEFHTHLTSGTNIKLMLLAIFLKGKAEMSFPVIDSIFCVCIKTPGKENLLHSDGKTLFVTR